MIFIETLIKIIKNKNVFISFAIIYSIATLNSCVISKPYDNLYFFTEREIEFLNSFTLETLTKEQLDYSNKFINNQNAVELGRKLFFDIRLSKSQTRSCASCHNPKRKFTDGLSLAQGAQKLKRNTPSILGLAYSDWFYWDGRKDSLWSQALAPLEDPKEQGISRVSVVKVIDKFYRKEYETIFGSFTPKEKLYQLPANASPVQDAESKRLWEQMLQDDKDNINKVFVNVGKAIAAFEATLLPNQSNFDFFVAATKSGDLVKQKKYMKPQAVRGMRLFMGKARCASCHNGPLFTNFEFHNIGVPERNNVDVDLGRLVGAKLAANDEFNCASKFSDANIEKDCGEIRFIKKEGRELIGAFKTPSLRNIAETGPYMHAGQFETLEDVLNHYNRPTPPYYDPKQHDERPHFDLLPLNFSQKDLQSLVVFLEMLSDKN